MNLIRGFVAVTVALAITLVFVQVLESTLATAMAGHVVLRFLFTTFVSILGGYVCAKIAAHDELRCTATAAIFRVIILIWAVVAGYLPATPVWMRRKDDLSTRLASAGPGEDS